LRCLGRVLQVADRKRGIVGKLAGFALLGLMALLPVLAPAQTPQLTAPPVELSPVEPPSPGTLVRAKSRWVPVQWGALPGLNDDAFHEAWNAWIRSCEKPNPVFVPLCADVRRMSLASQGEQLGWMMERLQPYRVEALNGDAQGLLTGYFEPQLEGSRTHTAEFTVPLYRLPVGVGRGQWFSRQEIDTLAQPQAALKGREIVWLADPVDALVMQIQGSGRVRVMEGNGNVTVMRIAFAGTNGQPYRSVGRWLLDRGEIKDGSWPGIRAWTQANPARIQEMLWSNPRVVFFKEELANGSDTWAGPRGAQGVSLTAGRSIAVDPQSIPYGTPVWLVSQGDQIALSRLVQAQDTGSAILGAVRADYFAGTGPEAGELAGRLKQPLQLWALWPR
jgi:membrane-bound lytic murein transglycosylase A